MVVRFAIAVAPVLPVCNICLQKSMARWCGWQCKFSLVHYTGGLRLRRSGRRSDCRSDRARKPCLHTHQSTPMIGRPACYRLSRATLLAVVRLCPLLMLAGIVVPYAAPAAESVAEASPADPAQRPADPAGAEKARPRGPGGGSVPYAMPPWRQHRLAPESVPGQGQQPGANPEWGAREWRGAHRRPPGWDLTPEERRKLRQDIYQHGRDVYRERPDAEPRP
jgi:hypothetical protein